MYVSCRSCTPTIVAFCRRCSALWTQRECAVPRRVTLNCEVMSLADCWNMLFLCAYSTQTVHPLPKHAYRRCFLRMSTSPQNDFRCQKLCHLSCTPITNSPQKYPFLVVLGPVNPPHRNLEIFHQFTHITLIHVFYFKSGQNWCMISGWKCDRRTDGWFAVAYTALAKLALRHAVKIWLHCKSQSHSYYCCSLHYYSTVSWILLRR